MTSELTAHPIVALWCHPRSMSTAVERIMRERRDFTCFHEPFIYYYYVHLGKKPLPHFDIDPLQPTGFDAALARLYEAAQNAPVFFKDMSYYVTPEIFTREDMAHRITHTFLIRDPRKSIVSYYKLDPGLELDEIGLEAQWRHLDWVREITGTTPPVIEAEYIQRDSRAAIGKLWRHLDVEFDARAFEWSAEAVPEEWQQVAGWHETASARTRIVADAEADELAIQSRFDAAAAEAPQLRDYLAHHAPFYEKLKAFSLNSND